MSYLLCIETASEVCSVALANETGILQIAENHDGNAHAALLTTLIQETVEKAGISLRQLDAIAVSKGPGSYTGLRVGVSTAKGLCYALDKPLIAVNTLEALVWHWRQQTTSSTYVVPMIDARRMEVYCLVMDPQMQVHTPTEASIINETSFGELLNNHEVTFIGNGATKCKSVIQHPNAQFVENIHCSAAGLVIPALQAYQNSHFEDVAYMEPYYLKDFVATTPKPR